MTFTNLHTSLLRSPNAPTPEAIEWRAASSSSPHSASFRPIGNLALGLDVLDSIIALWIPNYIFLYMNAGRREILMSSTMTFPR